MSSSKIKTVRARQIFDSRGRPTVEADVELDSGAVGSASVPSGASTGSAEAYELRDGDRALYGGMGVLRAVENVNGEIAAEVNGLDALDQRGLDEFLCALDGTPQLKRLGANAVLGVSLAACRASANFLRVPLYKRIAELASTSEITMPLPMVNILSGGLHAGRGMDVQDFLFIPAGARSFPEAVEQISRVRSMATRLALGKGLPVLLADEGGISPGFKTGTEALEFMNSVFVLARLEPYKDALIALDMAASSLRTSDAEYYFPREDRHYSAAQIIELIEEWSKRFCVASVEDALGEEDWAHWKILNEKSGGKLQIVGDDLFSTNLGRVKKGVVEKSANAVLIKLNQNGTLSGTLDVVAEARKNGLATIVSARSGETADDFIADLAVGTAAGQIKIGSFRNSERLSKYNRLLRIAEETDAPFYGASVLAGEVRK